MSNELPTPASFVWFGGYCQTKRPVAEEKCRSSRLTSREPSPACHSLSLAESASPCMHTAQTNIFPNLRTALASRTKVCLPRTAIQFH